MNQKKCPKCGENNPPEAVMCWACYTPLSGGAAAGAAAPAGKPGGPAADSGEEKEKPPAWQMGVIGVGLLAALYVGASSMGIIGGSGGGDDFSDIPPTDEMPPDGMPSPDDPGGAPPPPPQPSSPDAGGDPAPQQDYTAPFTVVSPANPKSSVGVMAIMPTKTVSPERAASLAAFAYRQVVQGNRWPVFHVFVFNNDKAAEIFKDYQARQRSAPLDDDDYRRLMNIWPNVYVRYEYRRTGNRGVETVRYPYRNPTGWWTRQSS